MAKKKTVESIIGTGKDPNAGLMVQKSIPLFSLWQSDMSLSDFKILDTYLSRINSHDPKKRTVIFTKGELEKLLGIKKINKPQLAARLKSLGRFVDVEDRNAKKIHQIALFEEAYGEIDSNGLWTIKLTCTTNAMKYIFNIEKLGYLRYKLHSIVCLKSRYAYVLFLYLEHNRFRKSWEVDVDVLRKFLNCDQDESYAAFKVFNDRILKRCQKELLEKTDCRFTYEPIKTGRKVTSIKFTLETLPKVVISENYNPDQYTLEDWKENKRDEICRGFSSEEFSDFSDEELRALKDLGWDKKRDADVERHNSVLHDTAMACEYAVSDYLRQTILVARTKHPKNLFLYVKKMLENAKVEA